MFLSFKNRNFYYPFLIWIIVSGWYLFFAASWIETSRLRTQDFFTSQSFYLFSKPIKDAEKIVIIAIDHASIQKLNLKWPWKRKIYAELIRNISAASPKVIGMDIVFSGKSDPLDDQELLDTFKSRPNIILAYTLGETNTMPLPEFINAVDAIGYVNKPTRPADKESEKIIRQLSTFYVNDKEKKINPSIETLLLMNYLNLPQEKIRFDPARGIFQDETLLVPSPQGIMPLNYLVHFNKFTTIPAYRILEKKINPALLKDKIVLIGTTDPLIHDEHLTPLGIFPGVAIIANSLLMMLSREFISSPSMGKMILSIFSLSVLIIFLTSRIRLIFSCLSIGLMLLTAFFASLYLRSKNFQFDYFSVFFLMISAGAISNLYKYIYLLYINGKLKNLAIKDTLTGFYNSRYFLLKIDEELKSSAKKPIFIFLLIDNYRQLILDLTFEELKSLVKLFSGYLETALEQKFKKAVFSRISHDTFCVEIWEKEKTKTQGYFKELFAKLKITEFKIEEKIIKISLKGMFIFLPADKKISSREIISQMRSVSKTLRQDSKQDTIYLDLNEKILETKKETPKEDIFDFLVEDLEARNKELEKTLKKLLISQQETETAYFETILSLIEALEEKDTYTQGHSERVAKYALGIAKQLSLPPEECGIIYKVSLLHDIGKIGIPDYILHKKEKLTAEETNIIRKHSIISMQILKPLKPFKDLLPIILHHHERFDGTGYPHGLSAEMIPKGAQILAVADSFDAITCGRGYKSGLSVEEAIKELENNSGTQLNPLYIQAFKTALNSGLITF